MSQTPVTTKVWIARDYARCSGCRLCEIACSLHHEGKIWPEDSRVRVFMLVPGVEIPHLCTQCSNYPCVDACLYDALSVNDVTGAVEVANEKCTACSVCINACPGKIPHLHPDRKRIVICDLCGGDPQCAKICTKMGFNTLATLLRVPSPTMPNVRIAFSDFGQIFWPPIINVFLGVSSVLPFYFIASAALLNAALLFLILRKTYQIGSLGVSTERS